MLKITMLEMFARTIPEGLIYIFAGYVFAGQKLDIKRWLLSGVALGATFYLIRLLPIHFGVHSILGLMLCIFLLTYTNQLNMIKAISSGMVCFITLYICEWFNIFIVTEVLKIPVDVFFGDLPTKLLYSFPSLLLFFLIILFIYYIKKRRKRSKREG